MTTRTLTTNELKALTVLVRDCNGSSRANVEYLLIDPFTWTSAETLIENGYSRHEAAGYWSSLLEVGMVQGEKAKKGQATEYYVSEDAVRLVLANWQD